MKRLFTFWLISILIIGMITVSLADDEDQYQKALELLAEEKYLDASAIFEEISTYKDANYYDLFCWGMHYAQINQYDLAIMSMAFASEKLDCQGQVEALIAEKEAFENEMLRSKTKSDFATSGTIVNFGRYEQDDDETNGPEDIFWYVVFSDGKTSYLLSKDILDSKPFHEHVVAEAATWGDCTLREWLNDEFYNNAFSPQEKKAIIKSKNKYENAASNGGSSMSEEFVTIPSYSEYIDYIEKSEEYSFRNFSSFAARIATENNSIGYFWLRDAGKNDMFSMLADYSVDGLRNNERASVRPVIIVSVDRLQIQD